MVASFTSDLRHHSTWCDGSSYFCTWWIGCVLCPNYLRPWQPSCCLIRPRSTKPNEKGIAWSSARRKSLIKIAIPHHVRFKIQ